MSEVVIGSKRDNSPIKVTNDDAVGMDEVWVMFFKCPRCKFEYLCGEDSYCANCGGVLEWNIEGITMGC